jgi:hypothetical protein
LKICDRRRASSAAVALATRRNVVRPTRAREPASRARVSFSARPRASKILDQQPRHREDRALRRNVGNRSRRARARTGVARTGTFFGARPTDRF